MDIQELYKWRDVFLTDGKLTEIRVLTTGKQETYSGYFYDIDIAIPMLKQLEQDPRHNFYFTVNEPKRACNSRIQFNSFQKNPKTTSKEDIAHRWWIPLDLDVGRVSDVASTDEEKEYAHQKALEVFRFLKEEGFPLPVVADSSSGYHLYVPADLANEKAGDRSELAVKKFFEVLDQKFSDEKVHIDSKPCDSNRIMRLAGFMGRKGLNTKERPHRLAKIIKVPTIDRRVTIEELEAFNDKYLPKEQPKQISPRQYNGSNREPFDVESFLSQHGVGVHNKTVASDGTVKYVLDHCAFNDQHQHPDAAIFVMPNGAISYKCLHDSCSDKDWKAFRLLFDPHAYDEKPRDYYRPTQYEHYRIPTKPQYEFKVENEELGKKWLCTKDVTKIDLSKLQLIQTGYNALDKAIKGLILGEVSIISGSNSSGKSSWLNCVMLNAREKGFKSALWSGELQKEMLVAWLQSAAAGNAVEKSKFNDSYYVPNTIIEKIDKWLDGWFYLYNNEYGNKWEQIFKDMEELVSADVKLFILDNLFSLDIDLFDGDNNKKQKELVMQICRFAKKNKVHIILVAHPRKSMAFLRKDDISGTSDIGNAADNIFIVHRNNNDFKKRASEFFGAAQFASMELDSFGNIIEVCKCRMFGNAVDSMCGMYYDLKSRQFTNEPSKLIEYGWRTQQEVEEYSLPSNEGITSPFTPNAAFDAPKQETETQTQSVPQYDDDEFYTQQYDDSSLPF